MEAQSDFRDLLALLNSHEVDYVIVGAYALAFHGAPRYTGDIDILIRSERQNAERLLRALAEFGFGSLNLSVNDFLQSENVIQLGVAPVRVDLLTSISGVSWEHAWASRESGKYGDIDIAYIGREQYVANKRATGRLKDLADIEALGES